jgi:two-component system phosphate regulon sensor histidine kinase PhoR
MLRPKSPPRCRGKNWEKFGRNEKIGNIMNWKNLLTQFQHRKKSFLPLIFGWILIIAVFIINILFLSPAAAAFAIFALLILAIFLFRAYGQLIALRAETEFKNREFEAVIENLREGVVAYDPNFKILSVNKAFEAMFGLRSEEVIGIKIEPGFIKNPRLRALTQVIFPTLAPAARQISEEGWPQIVDIDLEEPSLHLRTVLNRIVDKNQATIGFLKLISNLTREKEIIESKSEFISVAAHQLRTPLTGINWTFETLLSEEKDEGRTQILREGQKMAIYALKIVNDLLDVAKMEEGKFGYKFEEGDIMEVVENTIRQAKAIAKESGITLYFTADKKSYPAKFDAERLGIAFWNLLDNAIRYNTKNGSVYVSIQTLAEKPFVRISVRDTGIGIPEEEIKKLFTKFYRSEAAKQIEPNGSGLGLYITKNIIKQHGGEVGVESSLGRGTTFWFTLPLDPKFIPAKELIAGENF